MQGPQLCTKPRHFCKLDVAISRMAFLDLNLHVLQVTTSNSNKITVQNCASDTQCLFTSDNPFLRDKKMIG